MMLWSGGKQDDWCCLGAFFRKVVWLLNKAFGAPSMQSFLGLSYMVTKYGFILPHRTVLFAWWVVLGYEAWHRSSEGDQMKLSLATYFEFRWGALSLKPGPYPTDCSTSLGSCSVWPYWRTIASYILSPSYKGSRTQATSQGDRTLGHLGCCNPFPPL